MVYSVIISMVATNRAPVQNATPTLAQRFKKQILQGYFVRFHMSLILTAVIASGVLSSKLMMMAGILFLPLRYTLAVLSSYLVFLLMVRLWVWYVMSRPDWGCPDFSLMSWSGSSGGGGSGASSVVSFGGGDSGGAGASSSWVEGPIPSAQMVSQTGAGVADSGGSSVPFPDIDGLDLGDDGWWIMLLLAILIAIFICAGGYLIWVAPDVLPEAAWQVALAHGINRASKGMDPKRWALGIMRVSMFPLLVVLLAAIGLGWEANHLCPHAVKLAEAFRCTVP